MARVMFPLNRISTRVVHLSQPLIFAFLFTIFLVVWEGVLFQTNYLEPIQIYNQGIRHWTFDMVLQLMLLAVCSLILSFMFFWIVLNSGRCVRLVGFSLFAVSTLYEYAYLSAAHRSSMAEDVIMALQFFDVALYGDTVSSFFEPKALVPIAIFILLVHYSRPKRYVKPRVFVSLLILIAAMYSYVFHIFYLANEPYSTLSLSNFGRTLTFAGWKLMESAPTPRESVAVQNTLRPTNNIVLVIDESLRADHFSINGYSRPTTPYLEELERRGVLANWGEAAAGATATWQANPLLLTGLTTWPDPNAMIQRMPVIYQYAKAMGYTTYYLDASSSQFWNGRLDDLQYIDHWENADQLVKGPLHDADIFVARRIRELTDSSTGNFIVVNKRGVHLHYNRAFPESATRWQPIMEGQAYEPAVHEAIVNSYDNGIYYNVETFFRALVDPSGPPTDTTIVYTSDHGQTLAEDGATWSHANTTRNEARVPLFILASTLRSVDTDYRASHKNIFPTLLDLMGFPESKRNHQYALSLLKATASDSESRYYSYGALDGKGPGGVAPFDSSHVEVRP